MNEASCKDVARCLSAFVDGELEASDVLAIRAHLEKCEVCASRVAFARASRSSVRKAQRALQTPLAFQEHVKELVTATGDVERHQMATHYMLSWKVVGPTLAAASFALVWGAMMHSRSAGGVAAKEMSSGAPALSEASVSGSIDGLVNMLVDQHANPLPPETSSVKEFQRYQRFVGVPVRWLSRPVVVSKSFRGKLLGMRVVELRAQKRAAMFQYKLGKSRRLSVYVYNPARVRASMSHLLRRRLVNKAPVYFGYVRGYSVAVTDHHGVGYAVASDLDEQETSQIVASVGQ